LKKNPNFAASSHPALHGAVGKGDDEPAARIERLVHGKFQPRTKAVEITGQPFRV
jgi:hypothetical protein